MSILLLLFTFWLGGLVHALALEFADVDFDDPPLQKFVGAVVWPYDVYVVVRNHIQQ